MKLKPIFRDAPIRRKLIWISLLSTGIALLLIGLTLTISETMNYRSALVNDIGMKARIIGSNCAAALIFNDSDAAENNLKALSSFPNINRAVILTKDFNLFAGLARNSRVPDITPSLRKKGYSFGYNYLDVLQEIVLDGTVIGYVYIQSDLSELQQNLANTLVIILVIMCLAFFIAYLLIARLQKSITVPLLDMVKLTQDVSQEKKYSVRTAIESDDEIGTLAKGFNEMLRQIQKRDDELGRHAMELVEKVESRTSQLALANEQLHVELTERRRVEEELVRARDAAMEASAAKSIFLANMSHEIRTPMNAIIGFAELLENAGIDKNQREYLNIIRKSSRSLLEIINDILDFTKIESGKIEIVKVAFDIRRELESLTETFYLRAGEKNIELLFFLDPAIPRHLVGDPLRLKQVLSNLIGNAIKFTPEEGRVCVKAERRNEYRDEGLTTVDFSIQDNGIGIREEQQKTIFEPFTQADYSITRKFGGTGLGLAISNSIIKMMDGNLCLQSEYGVGSKFVFSIGFASSDIPTEPESFPERDLHLAIYSSCKKHPFRDAWMDRHLRFPGCSLHLIGEPGELNDIGRIDALFVMIPPVDTAKIKVMKALTDAPVIAVTKKHDFKVPVGAFYKVIYQPVYITKLIRAVTGAAEQSVRSLETSEEGSAFNEVRYNSKALVAEDVATNRMLAEILLNSAGIDVDIAENGIEAFEKFRSGHYDVIFMDVHMPACDGIEATKIIRRYEQNVLGTHIPIIALTADAMKGTRQHLLSIGMDDYISKPIEKDILSGLLDKYLGKGRNSYIIVSSAEKQKDEAEPGAIDMSRIAGSMGVTTDMAVALVKRIIPILDQYVSELREAIELGTMTRVREIAHRIKGSAANLRLEEMAALGAEMERIAKGEADGDCKKILDEISNWVGLLKKRFV